MNDVTARRLLEHGPFLRGLARALVGDAARADDVVQEAWLAALQGAPGQPGQLRPWLVAVVRNLARRARRDEGRRARREQVAAKRDFVRPTADVVVQEAARRDVVAAVLSLREPYRTAVLLRFYDDLPPREIARRCGVSGSTVRTRIQRGLEELRGRLDRARGGDRRGWCLALVPVAVPRAASTATATSALLTGVAAMKSKLVWVAAVFVCASLSLLWHSSSRAGRERSGEPPAAPAARSDRADTTPLATPDEARDAAEDEPASSPAQSVLLTGVVRLADGTQGEPVAVEVVPDRGAREPRVDKTVETGEEFRIEVGALFEKRLPVALRVTARHARHVVRTVEHPVVLDPEDVRPVLARLEITLSRAGIVRGAVQPAGEAAERVTVVTYRLQEKIPAATAAASTVTSKDGRYRLELEDGDYVVVAVAAEYRPVATVVRVHVGEELEVPTLVLQRGESIEGRVTVTGGGAAARAQVTARLQRKGHLLAVHDRRSHSYSSLLLESLLWTPERIEHAVVSVLTDSEGRYRIGGLTTAAYQVEMSTLENTHFGVFKGPSGALYARRATAPATGVDFEVALATVELVVRHAGEGLPDKGVSVTDHWGSSSYGTSVRTDDAGRSSFFARPGATYHLAVQLEGFVPQKRSVKVPDAGRRSEIVFDLERERNKATLVVTVRPTGPSPLPPLPITYRFELTPASGGETKHLSATAEKGRFRLPNLEPGSYRLLARASYDVRRGGYYLPREADIHLTAGATTDETLRVTPGGRIKILTRTPAGRTDTAARCWLETLAGERIDMSFAKYQGSSSWSSGGQLPSVTGPAYGLSVLRPAVYRVYVEPIEGFRKKTVPVRIEPGKTATVDIALERID